MSGDWNFLIALWTATIVVIVFGAAPIRDRQLSKWSIRFNVLIADASTASWLSSRLRRARAVRWTAFALALNIGSLPMYLNVIDVERASDYSNALTAQVPFVAAALGAVLAEVSLVGRPNGKRSAAIVTRRWSDYIERFWLMVIVVCAPISVVASWATWTGLNSSLGWLWVAPAAAVVAIVAATVGLQVVVNRPPDTFSEATLRLDDALRADGAHHVVGASVALGGMAACLSVSNALASSAWSLLPALATYVFLGNWYGIACTVRWNVDQARLQHA